MARLTQHHQIFIMDDLRMSGRIEVNLVVLSNLHEISLKISDHKMLHLL